MTVVIPFILRFEFLALSVGLPWSFCALRPQADEGWQRAEKVLRQVLCKYVLNAEFHYFSANQSGWHTLAARALACMTEKSYNLKSRKLRGLKRRQKNIDRWFEAHQQIDLDILKRSKYYYCKAKVDPWSNLYYEVDYPSNYRKQLFSHHLTIYELWKKQLEDNFDDFYLAIWVNDKRFIDSQVVSAIGDRAEYYRHMWNLHEQPLKFPIELFNHEKDRISKFNWESTDDEDLVFESEYKDANIEDYWSPNDYNEDMRFFRKLIKRDTPSRTVDIDGEPQKAFILKKGHTWIGKLK